MALFEKQIEFLRILKDQVLFQQLQQAFNQFGFVVKDFVVNKQLFQEGIDGNNNKLAPYRRSTIRYKISVGQPVDRTTLHDTERFVRSITIESFSDRFEVSSDVQYDVYIIRKYGIDVLKPTNENLMDFLINFYLPLLRTEVQNTLRS